MTDSPNVELVRSIIAAWEGGDYRNSEWADADIEFVTADGPEPGRSTGRAALAVAAREFLSPWQDARARVDELRELDGRRVLAVLDYSGRGR